MQTYLPYKEFGKCAKILKTEHLIKQRFNSEKLLQTMLVLDGENFFDNLISKNDIDLISKTPIFKFWWNNGDCFMYSLYQYVDYCNFELFNRNFKGILNLRKYLKVIINEKYNKAHPYLPKRITSGYRIILLCLDEEYYKQFFYNTYCKNSELISKLKQSSEKNKFSKILEL